MMTTFKQIYKRTKLKFYLNFVYNNNKKFRKFFLKRLIIFFYLIRKSIFKSDDNLSVTIKWYIFIRKSFL